MFGFVTKKKATEIERAAIKRGYAAAAAKARYGDFRPSGGSADYELRGGLKVIRDKSRALARNSSSMRRFLWLLAINVVGKNGILLQSRVRKLDGDPDAGLNALVERDFRAWFKRPTVCGRLTGTDLMNQTVKGLARDGESIWEIVYNKRFKDGIAINPIEPDYLDHTLNVPNKGTGNEIRMGVEVDEFKKPVAYHFLTSHPGDLTWYSFESKKRYRRVPADRIIHLFVSERAGQTRGEPWATTVINSIKMLDGYREAETTGRRLRSAIMGFFKRILPGPQGIDELADETDETDNMLEMSVEPGMLKELPPGVDFDKFDPGGSQTDYGDFEGQIKKDVSMGFMISSMSHGMEVAGVSYSAGRTITLEDRDFYSVVQTFIIEHMLDPILPLWLSRAMVQVTSKIPPTRYDIIINSAVFRPRGWEWVDPPKDVKANTEALTTGQTSLARVAAQRGIDRDDLLDEIQEDQKAAKKRGLTLSYNVATTNVTSSTGGNDAKN